EIFALGSEVPVPHEQFRQVPKLPVFDYASNKRVGGNRAKVVAEHPRDLSNADLAHSFEAGNEFEEVQIVDELLFDLYTRIGPHRIPQVRVSWAGTGIRHIVNDSTNAFVVAVLVELFMQLAQPIGMPYPIRAIEE